MKIGIDLDNTIINYDEVFPRLAKSLGIARLSDPPSKLSIKAQLLKEKDGERQWRSLQGQVYGSGVASADLYPGIYRFLWRCKARGIEVHILSHKTKFGHNDPKKIPLRREATRFLQKKSIFSETSDSLVAEVHFFDSQNDKVNAIREARFAWFVDDLVQVLADTRIPDCTKSILFCPQNTNAIDYSRVATSWFEIEEEILGDWSNEEIRAAAEAITGQPVTKVEWFGKNGNSGISKISFTNGRVAALKIYPGNRMADRLCNEYQAVKLIRTLGYKNVPEPLGHHLSLGVGVYEWIPGARRREADEHAVEKVLEFLYFLSRQNVRAKFSTFSSASASVFSGQQLVEQIKERISEFECDGVVYGVQHFVRNSIAPVFQDTFLYARKNWSETSFTKKLDPENRVLSPSDLGAHNWLHGETDDIYFLDFEYFGWDDPAKLICDFLLHPGMELNNSSRLAWIHGVNGLYGRSVLRRAEAMYGVLGVALCLIVLNQFRKPVAGLSSGKTEMVASGCEKLDVQLTKARRILDNVSSSRAPFERLVGK